MVEIGFRPILMITIIIINVKRVVPALSIQSLSIPAFEGEADPGKSLYLIAKPTR